MPYIPRRAPQLERVRMRGLYFQVYRWPGSDPHPTVLIHGWGDSGVTYQFMVDHLAPERTLLSFDCRGFGCTQWPQDGYWFPDYLADLEALLDQLAPAKPIDLVGHSMGGNIALLYAGVRPERVRRIVDLEGFGMQRTTPDQAPARYRQWLDELKEEVRFSTYDSFEHFASILGRRNPRTPADHLDFIARAWGCEREDGCIELRSDPRHKRVNPALYQREQAEACWRAITAPTLLVAAQESEFMRRYGSDLAQENLPSLFKDAHLTVLSDAGHMMHHERPAAVAELVEDFLR